MLIKNAKIVKSGNETEIVNILIESGKISKITQEEIPFDGKVIDAKERLTIPGGVEVHIHLREPGFESKETIETGTRAAARGGYTTVMPMPNLNPHPDNIEAFEKYFETIKKSAQVNVVPYACITKGSQGEELVNMKELNEKFGIRHFSDDGVDVTDDEMMRNAMIKSKEVGGMIIAHTEDMRYRKEGSSVHDGENARKNGWIGIPSETEYKQVERDLDLSGETGGKYHICHISAKESVAALREAKEKGYDASGEVTIHHLLLTEDDVVDTNYKMNPPLRTKEDRQVLIDALLDGTIDFLANDHAPHTEEEKARGMEKAPFGIVNIEIAIPLFYTHFVKTGKVTLEDFVNIISRKPAERFGLENKGQIKEGYDADLVIMRENEEEIKKDDFLSKGRNTPFDGWKIAASSDITICNGKIVWEK